MQSSCQWKVNQLEDSQCADSLNKLIQYLFYLFQERIKENSQYFLQRKQIVLAKRKGWAILLVWVVQKLDSPTQMINHFLLELTNPIELSSV